MVSSTDRLRNILRYCLAVFPAAGVAALVIVVEVVAVGVVVVVVVNSRRRFMTRPGARPPCSPWTRVLCCCSLAVAGLVEKLEGVDLARSLRLSLGASSSSSCPRFLPCSLVFACRCACSRSVLFGGACSVGSYIHRFVSCSCLASSCRFSLLL